MFLTCCWPLAKSFCGSSWNRSEKTNSVKLKARYPKKNWHNATRKPLGRSFWHLIKKGKYHTNILKTLQKISSSIELHLNHTGSSLSILKNLKPVVNIIRFLTLTWSFPPQNTKGRILSRQNLGALNYSPLKWGGAKWAGKKLSLE